MAQIPQNDPRIATNISRIAAAVAVVVTMLPPLGYFALSYQSQQNQLAAEARINAALAGQLITAAPPLGDAAKTRLAQAVENDLTDTALPEARRILDDRGLLIVSSHNVLERPVLTDSADIAHDGRILGRVEISRSLAPLLENTGLIALLCMALGLGTFRMLRVLPMRSLDRALTALRKEKERAEVTLAAIGDAVITTNSVGLIDYMNPAAQRLTGWPQQEATGRTLADVVKTLDEKTGEPLPNPLSRVMHGTSAGSLRQNARLLSRDSYAHFIEMTVSPIWDTGREIIGYVLALHDISMARQAEQSILEREERLRVVFDNATDGIITLDAMGHIETFNPASERIFGFTSGEVRGWHLSALIPGVNPAHQLHNGKENEFAGHHKSGNTFPLEMSMSEAYLGGNRTLVAIVRDITERKQSEERLSFLANYDSLTGLPNRILFRDRLAQAMLRAHRNEKLVALLFLDLDRFKMVNDSLGHYSGDTLLKGVAERLMSALRKTDTVSRHDNEDDVESTTVARLGGDEFTVIAEGIPHVDHAAAVAQRILDAFDKPFDLGDQEIFVSASVGITIYPFDDNDLDLLIKNADTAMYRAKDLGRNNYQFYTEDMNISVNERLQLEGKLRQALDRNEFSLHYQPQVDIASGKVIGVEALLRWQHPELGMVSPAKFIPVLEDTGLIIPVGEWALNTACVQAKAWHDAGLPLIVAVNLSPRQFRQKNLAQKISTILRELSLPPEQLELEITESLLMENSDAIIGVLTKLRENGIKVSVDDFGTGYSSLSYLKRFPIDTLKIDQSFVRDITTDPDDAAIASGIIALAHSLRLTVIAEGVETPEQLEFLRSRGCDVFQGFYTSRPVPADELEAWLRVSEEYLQ